MWTIWCIGDLNFFVATLNGLAMLFNSGFFGDVIKLGLLIGIVFSMARIPYEEATTFRGSNILAAAMPWLGKIIVVYAAYHFMFGTSTTVLVQDTYSLESQQVDNVPTGIAVAGSVLSKIGHELTVTIEQAFSTPTLTENGFASALEPLKKKKAVELIRSFKMLQNGNVYTTLKNYVADCTMICVTKGQLNEEKIKTGSYTWEEIKCPSDIYTTVITLPSHDEEVVSCTTAWNMLDNYFNGQLWDDWYPALQSIFCTTNPSGCNPIINVNDAMQNLVETSRSAKDYMLDVVMIPALEEGQIQGFSNIGKPEMSMVIAQARAQRNFDWTAQGSLFLSTVRPMLAFFEALIYAIAPFMAFMLAMPAGFIIIGKLFQMLLWIQFWMPTMAILNFFVQYAVQQKISSFDLNLPITSVYGIYNTFSTVEDWLAVAGYLTTAVPILSYAIITGGAYAITSVAGKLSSMGDYIDEKIARPDAVKPAPVFELGSMWKQSPTYNYDPISKTVLTGAERVLPTYEFGDNLQEIKSSAFQEYQQAQQAFTESLRHGYAHSSIAQQKYGQAITSNKSLQSQISDREALAYGLAKSVAHDLNFANNIDKISRLATALSGGIGARSKAANIDLRGNLISNFGETEAQKIMETLNSKFNFSTNRTNEAALMESLALSTQNSQELARSIAGSETTSKDLQQSAANLIGSKKQYSEVSSNSKNFGSQTSLKIKDLNPENIERTLGDFSNYLTKLKSNGLPPQMGHIDPLVDRYQKYFGGDRQKARWAALAQYLDEYEDGGIADPVANKALMQIVGASLGKDISAFQFAPDKYKGISSEQVTSAKMNDPKSQVSSMIKNTQDIKGPQTTAQDIKNAHVQNTGNIRNIAQADNNKRILDAYKKSLEGVEKFNFNTSTLIEDAYATLKHGGRLGSNVVQHAYNLTKGVSGSLSKFFKNIWDGKSFEEAFNESSDVFFNEIKGLHNKYYDFAKARLGYNDEQAKIYADIASSALYQDLKSIAGNLIHLETPDVDTQGYLDHRTQFFMGLGADQDVARDLAERELSIITGDALIGTQYSAQRMKQVREEAEMSNNYFNGQGFRMWYENFTHKSQSTNFSYEEAEELMNKINKKS